MGITYLPGLDKQLAPAIDQVAGALQNYFQPNKEFQKMVRDAIGKNPDLVTKFADIEARTPGTLARLGFGNVGQDIAEVPESTASQVDRATQKSKVAGATAASEADQIQGETILKAMRDNPQLTYQGAVARLKAPVTQQGIQQENLTQEQIATQTAERRQGLVKELPNLGEVDFYDEYRKFAQGQLSGQTVASYMSNPETANAFQMAQRQFIEDAQNERIKNEHLNAKKDTAADRLAARQNQNAYMTWVKTGQAGTVQAWEDFMYDPAAQTRAKGLLDGSIKPQDFNDEQLLQVAKESGKAGITRFDNDVQQAHKQIMDAVTKIYDTPDDQKPGVLAELNAQLEQRFKLGGFPHLHAKWDVRDFAPDKLIYTDDKGNAVDSQKVETMLTTPAAQVQLAAGAQNALTKILSLKPELREAALGRFRAGDTSPNKEDSDAITRELQRQGAIK